MITTDSGAKKIEGTDNWRGIFDAHNDTADALEQLAEDTAIIVNGNKTSHTGGAASGQYVLVRNSTITDITDGLYTASQAIPANTVIDKTYLTAVSGGGLNALNSNIASVPTTVRGQLSTFNLSGTSLSQLESVLNTYMASMSDGQVRIGRLYANYAGSITGGAQCVTVLYRQSATVYLCFILGSWKWGYYYSSEWHWL